MTLVERITQEAKDLQPQAQQQVLDFVAFLKTVSYTHLTLPTILRV